MIATIPVGCGDDRSSRVPPRIIEGGGIGDGPIDGFANIYVIDDRTREPIAGATVTVGTVEGTTDDTGLFVIEDVEGPQTISVKSDAEYIDPQNKPHAAFCPEMWIGANGANMTFNLKPATPRPVTSTRLQGSIDLSGISVPPGHEKHAMIVYSRHPDALPQRFAGTDGTCNAGGPSDPMPCNYSVDVYRTGRVALLAAVLDYDVQALTFTVIRWAYKGGIEVTPGVTQSGVDLTLIDVGDMGNVTVDPGSPPSGLTADATIGIDLGADGVFQLPWLESLTNGAPLLVPTVASVNGTGYRLTAVANNYPSHPGEPDFMESAVVRRDLTAATLPVGTWLAPPAAPSVTSTKTTWANVDGAMIHSFLYMHSSTKVLNVLSFDAASELTVPDNVVLLSSSFPDGRFDVLVSAIDADGIDPSNVALETVGAKLNRVSSRTVRVIPQ